MPGRFIQHLCIPDLHTVKARILCISILYDLCDGFRITKVPLHFYEPVGRPCITCSGRHFSRHCSGKDQPPELSPLFLIMICQRQYQIEYSQCDRQNIAYLLQPHTCLCITEYAQKDHRNTGKYLFHQCNPPVTQQNLICHPEKDKNVKKCKTVGNPILIMEAMPDIIQDLCVKADQHQYQDTNIFYLIPKPELPAE